jgi:predicted Zn-dependent protease
MLPTPRILILSLCLGLSLLVAACATVPYTGRRQLLFTSEGSEAKLGYQAFQEIKHHYKICRDPEINALVTRVGRRIAAAAQRPDYRWEFVVFDSKEANAFCLPGGKVGIFTGILKYTKSEAGLATVISHEVGHALARHAGERMSQSMLAQLGGIGLGAALGGMSPAAGQAIMEGYGLGTQMAILLPYSRTQEYEADHIGLILMAKAGYDPAQALAFWKRMMVKDKGVKLPQFLSTHPTDANRLRQLEAFLPEARRYYLAARKATTPPPPRRQWQTRNWSTPLVSPPPVAGRWLPLDR